MSETTLPNGTILNDATIASGQTDELANNTAISVLGELDNLGTLLVDSSNNDTDIDIGDSSGTAVATLTGGGVLLLSDNGANRLVATASGDALVNADNLIEGSGQIGAGGDLVVTNQAGGTIVATGTNAALTIQTGGGVANQGLIESSGPAGLNVTTTTISNTGTGELLAASGSIVLQGGATVSGGKLAASGGGEVFTNNASLDGSGSHPVTIALGATVNVDNNTDLSLLGTINVVGTLLDNSTGNLADIILATPTVSLTGGGVLQLSDSFTNRIYGGNPTNDTLVNVDDTIQGAGQLGFDNGSLPLALVNDAGGTIDAAGTNNSLFIETGGPAVSNAGLIEATGAGGLQITDGTTIDNTGTGSLRAVSTTITIEGGAAVSGGTLAATGGGQIFTNGASLESNGAQPITIAANTTVGVDNNSDLSLLGTIDIVGTLLDNSTNNVTDLGRLAWP